MTQPTVADVAKAPILAFNARDWEATLKTLASGITFDEVPTHRKPVGAGDVLTVWKGWADAFPDVKGSIDRVHVSGNTVTLEITWRGTHGAPLRNGAMEVPATGKRVEIRACQVVEVAGGTVAAIRHYWDLSTMMQQLGLTPAAA